GGMPLGAVGGRHEVMENLAPLGPVYQAGTLSGNPVAVAAGAPPPPARAGPGGFSGGARPRRPPWPGRRAARPRAGGALARPDAGVGFCAQSAGAMFGIYFRETPPATYAEVMQCDRNAFNQFFHAMLEAGVYLAPSAYEAGFVSSAHGAQELERTVVAARK